MPRRLTINVTTEQLDEVRAAQRAMEAGTRLRPGESVADYLDRQHAAMVDEYAAMLPLVAALLNADECERAGRAGVVIETSRDVMCAANEVR